MQDQITQANTNRTTAIILAVVILITNVGLGLFFARSITSRINAVTQKAKSIAEIDLTNLALEMGHLAQGDLTRSLKIEGEVMEVNSKDEIGMMGQAFNAMIANLSSGASLPCQKCRHRCRRLRIMPYPITVAQQILDEHIRTIEDLHFLEELVWERGAVVNYKPLNGAEAWMSYTGRKPAIITISSKIRSEERRRFSIAHELGHFEMHRFEFALRHCSRKDISAFGRSKDRIVPEDEANEFASAFLLPERFVGNVCRESEPSLSLISDMADDFLTSLEATARRFIGFSPEALAMVYCENDNIRRFKRSTAFRDMGLFVRVGEAVDQRTSTFAMLDNHTAGIGSIWRDIPVEAWLRPGDFRRNATIKEQSIGMPKYNAALSLLWVDDDIEED